MSRFSFPKLIVPTLAFALASVLGYAAAAQDHGLDLEAIRARAKEQTADAEALAATVRQRGQALGEAADATAIEARANGRRYTEAARNAAPEPTRDTFDFDRLVADAGETARTDLAAGPRFIAFASSSLPKPALQAMLRDVPRAGGVVVFRGLPGGSVAGLAQTLRQVLPEGENPDGVGIDPRLFRAFAIQSVPAYVVAASDFALCDGFDCATEAPPHDRIAGNVTARFALETFANGGGPGAKIAALHLARLEEEQP